MIVRIPPVRRLGIVRVEVQLVAVTIEVENVRIAIAVLLYAIPSVPRPSSPSM